MLQNPHRSQPEVHHAASKTGAVPVGTKKLAQQAQKRRILGVLSVQGELFRAHTHHQATQGELFAHKAQQHGDIETTNTTAHPQQGSLETGITSAPENAPKTPISHPQRRRRFQSRLGRRPQRRHRFQSQTDTSEQRRHRFQESGPPGLQDPYAIPVAGGGAWPGFEPTHQATHQRPGAAGVKGAGGTGGHGRASRRGTERSEVA